MENRRLKSSLEEALDRERKLLVRLTEVNKEGFRKNQGDREREDTAYRHQLEVVLAEKSAKVVHLEHLVDQKTQKMFQLEDKIRNLEVQAFQPHTQGSGIENQPPSASDHPVATTIPPANEETTENFIRAEYEKTLKELQETSKSQIQSLVAIISRNQATSSDKIAIFEAQIDRLETENRKLKAKLSPSSLECDSLGHERLELLNRTSNKEISFKFPDTKTRANLTVERNYCYTPGFNSPFSTFMGKRNSGKLRSEMSRSYSPNPPQRAFLPMEGTEMVQVTHSTGNPLQTVIGSPPYPAPASSSLSPQAFRRVESNVTRHTSTNNSFLIPGQTSTTPAVSSARESYTEGRQKKLIYSPNLYDNHSPALDSRDPTRRKILIKSDGTVITLNADESETSIYKSDRLSVPIESNVLSRVSYVGSQKNPVHLPIRQSLTQRDNRIPVIPISLPPQTDSPIQTLNHSAQAITFRPKTITPKVQNLFKMTESGFLDHPNGSKTDRESSSRSIKSGSRKASSPKSARHINCNCLLCRRGFSKGRPKMPDSAKGILLYFNH